MAFTADIIERAWNLSGGQCQCERTFHNHVGRCKKKLTYKNRGNRNSKTGWQVHSKSGANIGLADCEILCYECYDTIL
jgi:hypothetical protein